MNSSGNIGIGKDPASSYKFDFSGTARIWQSDAVSSLLLDYDGGYYGPSIEPSGNNACNLGQSNHGYAHVYAYIFHDLNSDSTQKENIRELNNALEIILGLRGIRFDLKKEIAYNDSYTDDPEIIADLEMSR
jgi:hypothetical protein